MGLVRIDSGEKGKNGTQIEAKWGQNICNCSVVLATADLELIRKQ